MSQLSVSYGILNDKSWQLNNNNTIAITHILPITKIITLQQFFYLTISRDGSIIWHDQLNPLKNLKLQIHSDWISDILYLYSIDDNDHYFISVSHDFSINLIHIYSNITNDWKWDSKIIGYHQDYIKCIDKLNDNTFVTTGLDNYINIWSIQNNDDETHLLKTFYHQQGSLYTLQCIENSPYPFDIIVGDCNGNILFYHSMKDDPIYIIPAHITNIKSIKLFDNNTKLLSTCSNGVVKIWDLTQQATINLLSTFQWGNHAVIWSIENDNDKDSLLISDSMGYISTFKFINNTTPTVDIIFHDPNYKKHPGLLTAIRQDNILKFAYCSNSNLNNFNLSTGELIVEEGGIALTRSSLLTNRRHVITENTKGVIQRWDIVSCELINTFDQNEGTFDDIVVKYTSHEILSHWCTVSIKVGILFVKIGPKFTNTEIYGNALKEYDLLNQQNNKDDKKKKDKKHNNKKHHHHHHQHNKHLSESDDDNNVMDDHVEEENSIINDEYRYNLGKVVINSLFNEFMKWEINQDDKFRHKLISDLENNNTNNNSNSNISYINSPPKQNKQKKKSTFPNLSISTSHFKSKELTENNTPYVSAPSTPVGELNNLPNDLNKMSMHHKSHDDLLHTALMDSTTLQQPEPKVNNSRAMSSGSLFTRKFRAFRNSSKTTNNKDGVITPTSNTPLSNSTNLERPHTTNGTPVNIDSQIDFNHNIFKTSNNSRNSLPESSQRNSMSSPSLPLTSHQLPNNSTPSAGVTQPAPPHSQHNDSKDFMSDLINEIHESYLDQLQNQSSLAKLSLTKRKVDSQIKRDHDLPIVKINSKTLLLVQSWNEGTCGGKVLFSTVLPMYSSSLQNNNLSSTSLISTTSSITSLDSSLETISSSSKNSNHSSSSSTTISTHGKLINKKIHHENKKLFTKIERNLPYWIGEILCKDDNVVQEKQPRLNFVIVPWIPEDQQDSIGDALPQVPSHHYHHHHSGFKLGKSKSNDLVKSSMTDLPKISESNTKLVAPGMIKVKKIKNYVVDRFEVKTPEMKEKIDPSVWIELLCKGQILDNDMTLSTVRTLLWKAQGEITINYRRKVPI